MSDFSLTLVQQIKTSKIINDMAKVQQKSEIITAFGGIFFVLDKFDSILNGKAVQTQHLLQQAIQTYLGTRIKQHPSLMLWSKQYKAFWKVIFQNAFLV